MFKKYNLSKVFLVSILKITFSIKRSVLESHIGVKYISVIINVRNGAGDADAKS